VARVPTPRLLENVDLTLCLLQTMGLIRTMALIRTSPDPVLDEEHVGDVATASTGSNQASARSAGDTQSASHLGLGNERSSVDTGA